MGAIFYQIGDNGGIVLVEFEKLFLNWGHFFTMGEFFKLGAKNYFGIEKISYFGNYMDPSLDDL